MADKAPALDQFLLVLADHAALHPDRTLTIVRSGISDVTGRKLPVNFRGYAVAWMRVAQPVTVGAVAIEVREEEGAAVVQKVEYPSDATASAATRCYVANLNTVFHRTGKHRVVFVVDGRDRSSADLTVKLAEPTAKQAIEVLP